MNAFETELGVLSEISQSINDLGWLLPTDIQSDAIPLILGGGDVLMAAETGSGKTGAFCIPVIQIVYETIKEFQKNLSSGSATQAQNKLYSKVQMNIHDRTPLLAIDSEGLLCQSRDEVAWHGCRSTRGVFGRGKYYYEATVNDEGLCRVGWSTEDASLEMGTDKYSFGFGGQGKKSNAKNFENYGEAYGINDTIGCYLDLDLMTIKWSKNGKIFDTAFIIPKAMQSAKFYAAVCMKNAEIRFNFGATPFRHASVGEYVSLDRSLPDSSVNSPKTGATKEPIRRMTNAPLAIIIEPSKELAEQTLKQIQLFKKNVKNPEIKELLLAGGIPVKDQLAKIQEGVDIVVATPGRLDDLISTDRLNLSQVQFFILDEVDGVLSQGHRDLIVKIYKRIPLLKMSRRLQMIVASATLHNLDVKNLAEQIMHFPTWIDLKGQDSVPDTIHHCVCIVDPKVDLRWQNLKRQIRTDDVHTKDKLDMSDLNSGETLSEAIKILKAEYCLNAIKKFNMDKALIFCRTKIDCDNLEQYFVSLGGGPKSAAGHHLSCVCLHADRTPQERSSNLELFKQNKVRFMICTDVAARGLDITGLPYVINLTLPDDKQNYVHRIGRVGRADRMGLAISFVAKHKEKVWFHTCQSRGKGCHNTVLKENGGCCIWYDELFYLDQIEDHLGVTISQVPQTLDVPVDEFDGKVVYGEKRAKKSNTYMGHVEVLAPTVRDLLRLEKKSQLNYLNMKFNKNLLV